MSSRDLHHPATGQSVLMAVTGTANVQSDAINQQLLSAQRIRSNATVHPATQSAGVRHPRVRPAVALVPVPAVKYGVLPPAVIQLVFAHIHHVQPLEPLMINLHVKPAADYGVNQQLLRTATRDPIHHRASRISHRQDRRMYQAVRKDISRAITSVYRIQTPAIPKAP